MNRLIWRNFYWVALALALPLFSQSANATPINFTCGGPGLITTACTGTVATTFSGATLTAASGSGITVINDLGPIDDLASLFTLAFSTSSGNVSVTEKAGGDGSTLLGTIIGAVGISGGGQTLVALTVDFTSLPADFAAFLGTPTGAGAVTTIDVTASGVVTNAGVNIIGATPEPASLALMGTGIIFCARLLRRKKKNAEAAITA
jgi:PEP-CTERM motif